MSSRNDRILSWLLCVSGALFSLGACSSVAPGSTSNPTGPTEEEGGPGNGDASTLPDGSTVPPLDCASYADAYCDKLNGCWPYTVQVWWGDAARCKKVVRRRCEVDAKAPGATAIGPACATALQQASCSNLGTHNLEVLPPDACIPKGTFAIGTACAFGLQCETRNCRYSNGGGPCGTCQPLASEGKSCLNVDCEVGLFCNHDKSCVKVAAKGEVCKDLGQDLKPCAPGLGCINGICGTPLPIGSSCDAPVLNAPLAVCDEYGGVGCIYNDTTQKRSCRAETIAKIGEACGLAVGGIVGNVVGCLGGLLCSQSGVCEKGPEEGDSCDSFHPCEQLARCTNAKCTVPDANSCK